MTTTTPSNATDTGAPVMADNAPVAFGVFNPQGQVVLGLPTQQQADDLVAALLAAGWTPDTVVAFVPYGSVAQLERMSESASSLADFGYERTLLNRYVEMSRRGVRWLLVTVDDLDHANRMADIARRHGAETAVYYRRFTTEDLI
ncbi:hypothetical protein [Roseateles sp.]|uniref:hypothetical protein n=1 Tax=Roseateles sp. TaxID=1971397 RepID=UPI003BAD86C1